ncbi:hypothetical protein SEUCBS139899_003305, partial [Sporothrix eucalyptigena]
MAVSIHTRTLECQIEDLVSRIERVEKATPTTATTTTPQASAAVQMPELTSVLSAGIAPAAAIPERASHTLRQPYPPQVPWHPRAQVETPVSEQQECLDNSFLASSTDPTIYARQALPPLRQATLDDITNETIQSPNDSEITGLNKHTNEIEFHGNTSSISFLNDLERASNPGPRDVQSPNPGISLVTDMHNHAFAQRPLQSGRAALVKGAHDIENENFYAEYAHVFIEAYFSGIHYVHPFVDKKCFISRANALWFGNSPRPSDSYIA